MMEWLMALDGDILIFIQENIRSGILTPIFTAVTTLGNSGIVWVIISLLLLISKRTRKAGVMSLLALLVSLLINNVTLKNLVARVRPYETIEGRRPVPICSRPYPIQKVSAPVPFVCILFSFCEPQEILRTFLYQAQT